MVESSTERASSYLKSEKFLEAQQLLQSGITNFALHSQHGSAQSLLTALLEVWDHAGGGATEDRVAMLVELSEGFPLGTKEGWGEQVVRSVVRWTSKNGSDPHGDPVFHHATGMRFYKAVLVLGLAKLYYDAEHHLVLGTSDSAKISALMAWTWSTEVGVQAAELGYFEIRNVFQYILLQRLRYAQISLSSYISLLAQHRPSSLVAVPASLSLPSLPGEFQFTLTAHPLLNMAQLVYFTVQRRAGDMYQELRKSYKTGQGGDPWVEKLLDKIGEFYFGIGVSRQPNLLNMLFGGNAAPGGGRGAGSAGPPRLGGPAAKRSVQEAELD
ncbi:hypothetical protein HDU93_002653 [Gonapodya sp. JEL0774]|nr:hypothetical protein HDU93_002653 [Gonapodya sp. JEL0774]